MPNQKIIRHNLLTNKNQVNRLNKENDSQAPQIL